MAQSYRVLMMVAVAVVLAGVSAVACAEDNSHKATDNEASPGAIGRGATAAGKAGVLEGKTPGPPNLRPCVVRPPYTSLPCAPGRKEPTLK